MRTHYTWTIEVAVTPDLVADGLDLSDPETVHSAFCRAFPYARMSGIEVAVVDAPSADAIRKEQTP